MRPPDVAVGRRTRRPQRAHGALGAQRARTRGETAALLASFVRFSALGATLILPLVGAATGRATPEPATAIATLAIGFGCHVFAYVLNDVVDLPIDRTDPRRAQGPLVNGLISSAVALTVAALALGTAVLAALAIAPPAAAACVAAGLGLGAYDLLGKRTTRPWLSDVVQGAGWGALVVAGAALAGGPTELTAGIAAYVTVFIVLANGVHGAIRDLANDAAHGVSTTARLLGATVGPRGGRVVPRAVLAYAWVLQVTLVLLTAASVGAGGSALAVLPVGVAIAVLASVSRPTRDADLLSAGMLHLVAGLLVPIALVATVATPGWMALTAAAFVVPLLTHAWLAGSIAWAARTFGRPTATAVASVVDLVRVTRPHNCLAAGAAVVVGAHVGGRTDLATEPVLRAAIVAALVVAAANVANDCADVAEDRINRPTRPIAAGRVSPAAAARLAAALAVTALVSAVPFGPTAVACVALLSVIAAAYSGFVPGIPTLKGTGAIGNVVVACLSGTTILFGALVLGAPTPAVAVATTAIAISVLSSEILKATADRAGDRAAGRRTLATTRSVAACLRIHLVLVVALVAIVVAAPLVGVVRPAFVVAALIGVVLPQGLILARSRGAVDAADVRHVLPLTKAAWFAGLASLVFLI